MAPRETILELWLFLLGHEGFSIASVRTEILGPVHELRKRKGSTVVLTYSLDTSNTAHPRLHVRPTLANVHQLELERSHKPS